MINVRKQTIDIVCSIIGDKTSVLNNDANINKMLHIIMSHSKQSIFFISTLEDEFNIEIEDEFINLDTFLNINEIVKLIEQYKI